MGTRCLVKDRENGQWETELERQWARTEWAWVLNEGSGLRLVSNRSHQRLWG